MRISKPESETANAHQCQSSIVDTGQIRSNCGIGVHSTRSPVQSISSRMSPPSVAQSTMLHAPQSHSAGPSPSGEAADRPSPSRVPNSSCVSVCKFSKGNDVPHFRGGAIPSDTFLTGASISIVLSIYPCACVRWRWLQTAATARTPPHERAPHRSIHSRNVCLEAHRTPAHRPQWRQCSTSVLGRRSSLIGSYQV